MVAIVIIFPSLSNGKIRWICKDLCRKNTPVMLSLTCMVTHALDGILNLIFTPYLYVALSANSFDTRWRS